MFEQQALQEYILLCCQNPTGGLLDKPGKSVPHHLDTHCDALSHSLAAKRDSHGFTHAHRCPVPCVHVLRSRDFYHTCYCLSGLSIAQHFGNMDLHDEMILGSEENRLVRLGLELLHHLFPAPPSFSCTPWKWLVMHCNPLFIHSGLDY